MQRLKTVLKIPILHLFCLVICVLLVAGRIDALAASDSAGTSANEIAPDSFDAEVLKHAQACATEVTNAFEELLKTNRLEMAQLFDTFYIPIPDTSPQKFHTQYDRYTDEVLIDILDSCLEANQRFFYVVAADINGYVPTHNSKYSLPLTNNQEYNAKNNRTKRMFNDRTGITAAKNTKPFLLQSYPRDTGQEMYDLSVPLLIRGKHWGALRVGYEH